MKTPAIRFPKGRTRKSLKAAAKRQHAAEVRRIRALVFEREDGLCRCCKKARATEMHEIVFRSLGGKVSLENSIAICNTCHCLLQSLVIGCVGDAQETLTFSLSETTLRRWWS